jgi:Glycosyltransferase family 87
MGRRRVIVAAAIALAAAVAALSALQAGERHHYRLSAGAAIAAARRDASDRAFLAENPTTGVRVIPLDRSLQRVTFFDGPRVVLDAAVDGRGRVVAAEMHPPGGPDPGGTLTNSPWFLVLMGACFVLATAVVPMRRIRNLDVAALLGASGVIVLLDERLLAASVAVATTLLAYLLARCVWIGLGRSRATTAGDATPLFDRITRGWSARRRTRLLAALVGVSVLVLLMVTMTSSGYTDVAAASLLGATDLLHGVLPYGHPGFVLHGDTYPILTYILYLPGAAWLPVTNPFSDLTGSLAVAAVSALAAGAALHRVGGLRAALAWFSFAPMVLAAASGSNDLLLAAALAWAVALAHRRGASLTALAAAAWIKVVPVMLLPLWLASRRRGESVRALGGVLAISLACLGVLIGFGGLDSLARMASAIGFQLQRGSLNAPWQLFHIQWL